MSKGEQGYLDMLKNIMDNGVDKQDRTQTGTRSIFGNMLRFDMSEGFPLLTTKKVFFRGIAVELLWFLKGSTNIRPLIQENVSIWTDWPLKHYNATNTDGLTVDKLAFEQRIRYSKEFAAQWGELGPVYGKQWRNWEKTTVWPDKSDGAHVYDVNWQTEEIDQIAKSIKLLRTNPESRRNIVMAWNPADIDEMAVSGLPPCHYGFQLCTRPNNRIVGPVFVPEQEPTGRYYSTKLWEKAIQQQNNEPKHKLDMLVNIRSWDVFLGGPFNIASYALLLHMYAQTVNMVPGDLIISSGDTHIYNNLVDQVKEQLTREPRKLPTLRLDPDVKTIDEFTLDSFQIIDYNPYPAIKGQVAV